MKMKIILDTGSSVARIVDIASTITEPIYLTDNNGLTVSAKSLLGAAYAKFEFSEIWLQSEGEYYHIFKDFAAD